MRRLVRAGTSLAVPRSAARGLASDALAASSLLERMIVSQTQPNDAPATRARADRSSVQAAHLQKAGSIRAASPSSVIWPRFINGKVSVSYEKEPPSPYYDELKDKLLKGQMQSFMATWKEIEGSPGGRHHNLYNLQLQRCLSMRYGDHAEQYFLELAQRQGDGPDPLSFNLLVRTLVRCGFIVRAMPYLMRLLVLHEDHVKRGEPIFMDEANLSAMCARVINRKDLSETGADYQARVDRLCARMAEVGAPFSSGVYAALMQARAYDPNNALAAMWSVLEDASHRSGGAMTPVTNADLLESSLRILHRVKDPRAMKTFQAMYNIAEPSTLLKTLVEERRASRPAPTPHAAAMATATTAIEGTSRLSGNDSALHTALRVEKSFDKALELASDMTLSSSAYHCLFVALAHDATLDAATQWKKAEGLLFEMHRARIQVHAHSAALLATLMAGAGHQWRSAVRFGADFLVQTATGAEVRTIYNSVMAVLKRQKRFDEFWAAFDHLHDLPDMAGDTATFTMALDTLGRTTDLPRLERVMELVGTSKAKLEIPLLAAMAKAQASHGFTDRSVHIFEQVVDGGSLPWVDARDREKDLQGMLDAFLKNRATRAVVPTLLDWLVRERGLRPTKEMYVAWARSMMGTPSSWFMVTGLVSRMREDGLQLDRDVFHAMLEALVTVPVDAIKVASRIDEVMAEWQATNDFAGRDVHTHNILLRVLMRTERTLDWAPNAALQRRLLNDMMASEDPQQRANADTFDIVTKYYCYKSGSRKPNAAMEFLQSAIAGALRCRERGLAWVQLPHRSTIEHAMGTALAQGVDVRAFHEFLLRNPYTGSFAIPLISDDD